MLGAPITKRGNIPLQWTPANATTPGTKVPGPNGMLLAALQSGLPGFQTIRGPAIPLSDADEVLLFILVRVGDPTGVISGTATLEIDWAPDIGSLPVGGVGQAPWCRDSSIAITAGAVTVSSTVHTISTFDGSNPLIALPVMGHYIRFGLAQAVTHPSETISVVVVPQRTSPTQS